MKLFAIITAGLMAVGGGFYYYTASSHCSTGKCDLASAPVAKSGGCCAGGELPACCHTQDECCELQDACCAVAVGVAKAPKPAAYCAAKEECCVVGALCCGDAATPTGAVTAAAKTIAAAKSE